MLEAFAPALAARLDAIAGRVERQIAIMGFLLRTYTEFPAGQVIRYEDMLANPEAELSRLTPHPAPAGRKLRAVDPASRYAGVDLAGLAEALWPLRGIIERFYPDFAASCAVLTGNPRLHQVLTGPPAEA